MATLKFPSRRVVGASLFWFVALAAALCMWRIFVTLDTRPRTTDASFTAEIVHVSAGVPGQVTVINIQENQDVLEGDVLFELDNSAFQLLRDQAQAQLEVAHATLADAQRTSEATAQNAKSANAEIDRAQTNLDLARATVSRLEPLAADGISSQQLLDEARTALAGAEVSLEVAQDTALAAESMIVDTSALQATVRVAEATLSLAEHNLSLTKVSAPFDGTVTGLNLSVGTWVLPEALVFSLIDTSSWRAEGYFRETDLAAIRPGLGVAVSVLSNPGTTLRGEVDSIGRGVLGTDALTLQGQLPFVAQTTNWVRLAKRYPVQVTLAPPYPDFLRIGGSATLVLLPGADP